MHCVITSQGVIPVLSAFGFFGCLLEYCLFVQTWRAEMSTFSGCTPISKRLVGTFAHDAKPGVSAPTAGNFCRDVYRSLTK
jgi:hypothetical protein